MNLDDWLHLIHVLAAMVWVGGGLILIVMAVRARSSGSDASLEEFARILPYIGLRLLMPAVVLLPVTGVWMVIENSQWRFSQEWVRIAIGLFIVAFLVGAVYLSRVGIQLDRASRSGAGSAASMRPLVGRWLAGYAIVLAVLLVAVWDMVFKPGL